MSENDYLKVYTVPVKKLLSYDNAMEDSWGGVITVEDVKRCADVDAGSVPNGVLVEELKSWAYHVSRIAWLAREGWTDTVSEGEPVTVNIYQINSQYFHDNSPRLLVIDGNHRLAAAYVRGDANINVVVKGLVSEIDHMLLS